MLRLFISLFIPFKKFFTFRELVIFLLIICIDFFSSSIFALSISSSRLSRMLCSAYGLYLLFSALFFRASSSCPNSSSHLCNTISGKWHIISLTTSTSLSFKRTLFIFRKNSSSIIFFFNAKIFCFIDSIFFCISSGSLV